MDGVEVFIYIYCLPPAGGRCVGAVEGRRERGGERGRGAVYEAYEVKKKRQKMRCLLLRREKKNIIFYL